VYGEGSNPTVAVPCGVYRNLLVDHWVSFVHLRGGAFHQPEQEKAPDRWNGHATQPAGIQDGLTITPTIALDPKD
jgi:hypothetical protein